MAELKVVKFDNKNVEPLERKESSHLRQTARKAGIDVPEPQPSLTKIEQEEVESY